MHDPAVLLVNSMAVEYGLLDATMSRTVLARFRAELARVGYARFELGVPASLRPLRRKNIYVASPQARVKCRVLLTGRTHWDSTRTEVFTRATLCTGWRRTTALVIANMLMRYSGGCSKDRPRGTFRMAFGGSRARASSGPHGAGNQVERTVIWPTTSVFCRRSSSGNHRCGIATTGRSTRLMQRPSSVNKKSGPGGLWRLTRGASKRMAQLRRVVKGPFLGAPIKGPVDDTRLSTRPHFSAVSVIGRVGPSPSAMGASSLGLRLINGRVSNTVRLGTIDDMVLVGDLRRQRPTNR